MSVFGYNTINIYVGGFMDKMQEFGDTDKSPEDNTTNFNNDVQPVRTDTNAGLLMRERITPSTSGQEPKPAMSRLQKLTSKFRRSKSERNPSKAGRFFKKYWYIIVILLLAVGGAIGWRVYQMNIDATWSKASDHYGRADYEAAAKLLEGMSMPTDEKRLIVYAQTMLATRQLDKALPAYTKLYELKKDPDVKIKIGNIYNEQKKYDEAAKAYKEIISANTAFVQAYVNLATLYKLQGKNQDAIETAKQGVKSNPNSVTMHELLVSMLLEDKESSDYKEAVKSLEKLNPSDPLLETLKQ